MATRWLTNPTSVYCLVAAVAFARAVTLTSQQQQQTQQTHVQYQAQNGTQNQQQQQLTANDRHSSRHEESLASTLTRQRISGTAGRSSTFEGRDTSVERAAQQQQQQRHQTANNGRNSSREPSTRIESLDDVSHRLDQTSVQPALETDDTRVPFWNIAHMINSIEQVDLALRAGSNGIETDVSFDAQGKPVEAYHGFPCDCGRHCHHREEFVAFVRHLARITVAPARPSRLFVVLLDLKLADLKEQRQKETAGRALAEILHKNLYGEFVRATGVRTRAELERNLAVVPPVRVVVSINHAHDLPLTRAFLGYMRQNRLDDFMGQFIGWDVGMNDPLENITSAWDSLRGATTNIWQGDGLTNCANIVRGVERLKGAISVRNNQGHFRKVYYWTADVLYHIRSVLRLGLDAILTNQPQRAIQVLQEPEFRHKYRLATAYDDPFEQFSIKASAWRMSFPSVGEINETVANIQKTGENFIKTLPDGVAAAFKKVQSSIG